MKEGAQMPASYDPIHFADGGAGQGTVCIFQADEAGEIGGLSEQLVAPFFLEGKAAAVRAVRVGGALFPVPVAGGPADESAAGFQAYDLGDGCKAAREREGEEDLEPAVAVERFVGLPLPWIGLARGQVRFSFWGPIGLPEVSSIWSKGQLVARKVLEFGCSSARSSASQQDSSYWGIPLSVV